MAGQLDSKRTLKRDLQDNAAKGTSLQKLSLGIALLLCSRLACSPLLPQQAVKVLVKLYVRFADPS
jgi:hypothetical protein